MNDFPNDSARDGRLRKADEQLNPFDLSIMKEDEPRFFLDWANLVYNWLKKNQGAVRYEFQEVGSSFK